MTQGSPDALDTVSGIRTIGVLADIEWTRGPVTYHVRPGRGILACRACVENTEHERYRPVRRLRALVSDFLRVRDVSDVVNLIARYGFPVERHGGPRRPARIWVGMFLGDMSDLREFRRLAFEPPSRRLMDEHELGSAADEYRRQSQTVIAEALALGTSVQDAHARVDEVVPKLSENEQWRQSVEVAGWRRLARDQLTRSVREMKLEWAIDPTHPVVELVPTSLIQLVSYAMLLELRGDERVGMCLECQRPLPDEGVRRGRPRLYCPRDKTGRDCAAAAENRRRRQSRRIVG